MYIEPKDVPFEEFQASPLQAEGMKVLDADFSPSYGAVDLNVEYAVKDGYALHLQILRPKAQDDINIYPLIVYVQGSAWLKQSLGQSLAPLLDFAKKGFVIAIVEYRPSIVVPFPAQIKDTKTAIRFMLEHAHTYNVDPKKVIVWGDSSGGHTASMINVTLNKKDFTDEPEAVPLDIRAFVNYFGPSDISRMNEQPSTMDHLGPNSPEGSLIGQVKVDEHLELVAPTIPMNHLSGGERPMLIMHGDKDRLVPFHQSLLLYEAMKKAGSEVEFYKILGADHGGAPFWSQDVLNVVEEFIRRWLK